MKPPAEVNLRISHKLIERKVETLKQEILNEPVARPGIFMKFEL